MKFKELKSMSKIELENKIVEVKKELIKLNAQVATGTNPKSPGLIKQSKKTIARIETILGSRAEAKKE